MCIIASVLMDDINRGVPHVFSFHLSWFKQRKKSVDVDFVQKYASYHHMCRRQTSVHSMCVPDKMAYIHSIHLRTCKVWCESLIYAQIEETQALEMKTRRSTNLAEYPHSLSYQATSLTN